MRRVARTRIRHLAVRYRHWRRIIEEYMIPLLASHVTRRFFFRYGGSLLQPIYSSHWNQVFSHYPESLLSHLCMHTYIAARSFHIEEVEDLSWQTFLDVTICSPDNKVDNSVASIGANRIL